MHYLLDFSFNKLCKTFSLDETSITEAIFSV